MTFKGATVRLTVNKNSLQLIKTKKLTVNKNSLQLINNSAERKKKKLTTKNSIPSEISFKIEGTINALSDLKSLQQ